MTAEKLERLVLFVLAGAVAGEWVGMLIMIVMKVVGA